MFLVLLKISNERDSWSIAYMSTNYEKKKNMYIKMFIGNNYKSS